MTLVASEISVTVESSKEISVVIDCAQPVDATVEIGGAPGASAYDIWLQQPGNSGKTVVQYLESQRGPTGPRGETGPPGLDATGLGGYPVVLVDVAPGDYLEFGVTSEWINGKRASLTDGGNF